MSNRLSCLGALAAFIVAALLSPFSRVAGSKGKNFYLYDFCIMKCKMALLLSAFAFAPSVLAEVPVVTLSVDNIQVRAEWRVVPQDNPDFRMDGNTLVFQSNITGAGKPNGATIIATVEVLDKFSTLNPLYEDLTTRVKITTVVMGCHVHRNEEFLKAFHRQGQQPPQQMVINGVNIKDGDIIRRESGAPGYRSYILHTVTTHGGYRNGSRKYLTTSPSLFNSLLGWDQGHSTTPWAPYPVNDAANCFDRDIELLEAQNLVDLARIEEENAAKEEAAAKQAYFNLHAPKLNTGVFAGGVYAGDGNVEARVISVGAAFVLPGEQFFWLFDVTLVNILKELYPITVINNDVNNGGKAFTIVGDPRFYPKGSRGDVNADLYEYVVNLPAGSSGYGRGNHQVIIVNSCPTTPPVSVIARKYTNSGGESSLRIDTRPENPPLAELAAYPYVLIDGVVYKFNNELTTPSGGGGTTLSAPLFDASSLTGVSHTIKFADHFLCESI